MKLENNPQKFVPVTNSAKGEGGGLPKYLWDSPMEQTNEKGEAVSSNNGSTAHYPR